MTPFKLHIIFGLILLTAGILFGFLFVGWESSEAFRGDPAAYLLSFKKQLYDLTLIYIFVLAFLNIVFALLTPRFAGSANIDWTIFGLVFAGSIVLIATGFWYANAGPSFEWEPRCTVLTVGLLAVASGLGLEIYKVIKHPPVL